MSNNSSNIQMLHIVAKGLAEFTKEVIFVGGSVAELYADIPELSDIRPTDDIDCVVEILNYSQYNEFENQLRLKGFQNDTTPGAPICRWTYQGIKVDFMPMDENILGFSNVWYSKGIQSKRKLILSNGIEIYLLSPFYYMASKLLANDTRGEKDLRQNHDFEDIIYMLDNCKDLINSKPDEVVGKYLSESFQKMLKNPYLLEGIESALPYGSDTENIKIIVERIKKLAKL